MVRIAAWLKVLLAVLLFSFTSAWGGECQPQRMDQTCEIINGIEVCRHEYIPDSYVCLPPANLRENVERVRYGFGWAAASVAS